MLTNFSFTNFKSFISAKLPFAPLTVMIGANAAGKSNAIEALRLLSWIAQGQRLSSIQYAVNSKDRVVRGRVDDLCHRGTEEFLLHCTTDDAEWNSFDMKIAIRNGELHIVWERIKGRTSSVPLYDLDQPSEGMGTDAGVAYNNFSRGGTKPHVRVTDQMAVFVQFEGAARFVASHKVAQEKIPDVCRRYQSILSNIIFLDPQPSRMRDYSFTGDKKILGDGTNLSSALYHLWAPEGDISLDYSEDNVQNRLDILQFIQSLPEQDITELSFLFGPRGEVMVQLLETFGGTPRLCDAVLLSDGTLRVLAIAAAMLSANTGSLVVIEEIDNGVHPSRAKHLLETTMSIAERRSLRVLLSTHNPAMMDSLPDAAIPNVVFCYRNPATGSSELIRLGDVEDGPEILMQGPLGNLMTTGALERFIKNRKNKVEKKSAAKSWLKTLRQESV